MHERAAIDRGAGAAVDIHPTSLGKRPCHTRAATGARTAGAANGLVVGERGVRHDDGNQVIDVESTSAAAAIAVKWVGETPAPPWASHRVEWQSTDSMV